MKFAFSTNAFRRYSLVECIRILAAVGYEGVEIMADVPHAYPLHVNDRDIEEICKTLDENRLAVSNVNAFMHHADGDTYHPSWIENDPALRAKRVDYTRRCIDLAAKLGARSLSTEPGGPLQAMTREKGLELFMEGLAAVEERAGEKGIRVLIEPEPDLLIENSSQFLDLFEMLNPRVFGINFDIGHFFCVGEDPAELIQKMSPLIHHFHLEDIASTRIHHHLQLGHGAIDIPRVLKAIEEIGYEGYVTVELYTYEDSPGEAARLALEYLQRRPMG